MIGITLDNPWQHKAIITTLKSLKRKIHVRIVFDLNVDLSEYKIPVQEISKYAFIVGMVCDSFYVKNLTPFQYFSRCLCLKDLYQSYVSIWEIGNEINGDWLGKEIERKLESGLMVFAGQQKAITLYADEKESYYKFINDNFDLLSKMQYIFISEYPEDNNEHHVDLKRFAKEMLKFNAYWGFGECGTKIKSKKVSEFRRYYKTIQTAYFKEPNFVGGYFWWYQKDFMKNGILLKELQEL